MAEADFEKLKKNLKSTVEDAWAQDKDHFFQGTLKSVFGKAAREKYMACTVDPSRDFYTCLAETADELGLGDKFRTAWKSAPTALKTKLKNVQDQWTEADRAAIRTAIRGADIPRLYKMCAYGKYGDVASELKLDTTPAHFKACVSAVAAEKDLEATLTGIWGRD